MHPHQPVANPLGLRVSSPLVAMTQGHSLKVPDHRNADAAGAADTMQHLDRAAQLSRRTTRGDNMSHNASFNETSTDVDDRKSAGSSKQRSVQAQHKQASSPIETTLAHRAALNRLNGVSSKKSTTSDNVPSTSSQPVLVKSYSAPESSQKPNMGKRRKPSVETSELPSPESFSFQDILREIDPEIQVSIDAIAEVYGRSKLSLADEYGSHRPPLGGLDILAASDQADAIEAIQGSRLEPVEESTPSHSRRHSLALVGTSTQPKSGLSSNAVAATSDAMSVSQQRRQSASMPISLQADNKVALLPYILSWLRNSGLRTESVSNPSSTSPRAAESLHRILSDS
ncbi:MAG: hypothetical protein Q9195_006522 [Heterodermia aff. obscurata]